MTAGRPTDYTEEIAQQAWDYVNGGWEDEDHAFPSVVGLCKVLNRSRSVIYAWGEDPDKQFQDILASINESQELVCFSKAMKGEYNATMAKLLLGKHGYHDKADNTHSGPDGKPIETTTSFNFIPVGPKK